MFKNYLKIAWRNLWKNRFYAAINIVGLAIGMAACIIIMLFVFYEKSFDSQHTKNIYRLNEVQKFEGMVAPQNVALSMYPMATSLKNEFPEIINYARIWHNDKVQLSFNEKRIVLEGVCFVDSTFLQLFDFRLLHGNRNTVLKKPNSLVLTETSAKKLFGQENAVGKTVTRYSGDTVLYTVTGIMEDVPKNCHLQFDGLYSFSTLNDSTMNNNWGGNWLVTYLELAPNTNVAKLEKKFPAYLKRHLRREEWKFYELFLQPLKDVHAGSTNITHDYLNHQKFDKVYTYLFSVIALIVLVIACINFMNLSTARSAGRAREVGIRKSFGAMRFQLAGQFIGEAVMLSLIALILAMALVKLLLPFVVALSQRELQLPLFDNVGLLLLIIAGTIIIGILSGLYPAAYLSSFRPVKVLKGTIQTGKNKGALRNILVVGQFTGAIFLIIATVFAVKQLRFMREKDPGFNREQVVLIPLNAVTYPKYDALKQALLQNTLVKGVTASGQRLGNNLHQSGMIFHGDGSARTVTTSRDVVDPDYLSLYDISLTAGRNFSKDYNSGNGKEYIINEAMARELLKDHPGAPFNTLLDKMYGFEGIDSAGRIIGIVRDFNFNSLHNKIETLSLFNQKDWGFSEISVRINGNKAKEAIAWLEATWKKLASGEPFEYTFLDEHFEELYKADTQVSKIIGALATLAIIIACLGLFGLASYAAEKRVKEIGIRKVLGATEKNIVALISGDFLKLVLIANLIAWPLAWYALNRWLEDFAYRIAITWWVFVAAGLTTLLIALLTVSVQAIKAAIANPVTSLRTE